MYTPVSNWFHTAVTTKKAMFRISAVTSIQAVFARNTVPRPAPFWIPRRMSSRMDTMDSTNMKMATGILIFIVVVSIMTSPLLSVLVIEPKVTMPR